MIPKGSVLFPSDIASDVLNIVCLAINKSGRFFDIRIAQSIGFLKNSKLYCPTRVKSTGFHELPYTPNPILNVLRIMKNNHKSLVRGFDTLFLII